MNTLTTKFFSMLIIASFMGFSLIISSCEGPAGKDGIAGADGQDGQEQCGKCHNSSSLIVARQIQWAASKHATNAEIERTSTSCAPCHTSEGFHETLNSGEFNTAAEIMNPTGQNCRTCHNVHEDYAETDWALRKEGDVKFRSVDGTYNFGKGAVCATCHQARAVSPTLDIANASATYQITSTNFGPHYSTAANAFAAKGALEIPGEASYPTTFAHKSVLKNSCVDCHMGKARGADAGGHTMKMTYASGTSTTNNIAVCTPCHETAKNFDIYDKQTETKKLLADLRALLIEKNLITSTNPEDMGSDRPKAGTYPVYHAAAVYNYRWVLADQSYGIHNPGYIAAVLKNSIAALK